MEWLVVLLWGGIVGLDATSFPQVMISRPLPAAALLGALIGEPLAGALIGGLVEVFSLSSLPMGAARYPESGTAAVAATGAYAVVATGVVPPLVLLAVVFALGWERVTGGSVAVLRRVNERIAAVDPEQREVGAAWVTRRHLLALGLDFGRAASLTMIGWGFALVLLAAADGDWGFRTIAAFGALAIGGAALVGSVLPLFGRWSDRGLVFLLGLVLGIGLALL
ncbi:MAG: PTS sugar transporter subunit IIC [Longimicrobiales bacterium]